MPGYKTESELREIEGFKFYRDNSKSLCEAGGETYCLVPGKGYELMSTTTENVIETTTGEYDDRIRTGPEDSDRFGS